MGRVAGKQGKVWRKITSAQLLYPGRKVRVDDDKSEAIVLVRQSTRNVWIWHNGMVLLRHIRCLLVLHGQRPRVWSDQDGFRRVWVGRGHPLNNGSGYIYAYHLPAIAKIGLTEYRSRRADGWKIRCRTYKARQRPTLDSIYWEAPHARPA